MGGRSDTPNDLVRKDSVLVVRVRQANERLYVEGNDACVDNYLSREVMDGSSTLASRPASRMSSKLPPLSR
jgi:hypothetical protein